MRLAKVAMTIAVIALVAWIYLDAINCARRGGTPVAGIGHFVCIEKGSE